MAIYSVYVYGLGLTEPIYAFGGKTLDNLTYQEEIGTKSTDESFRVGGGGDVPDYMALSSSNTEYVPITTYKIIGATVSGGASGTIDIINNTVVSMSSRNSTARLTLEPVSSGISLDLSTIGLPAGTHSIQMKLSDDGVTKADSELSNAVSYTVEPEPTSETWVIKYGDRISTDIDIDCNFVSNNQNVTHIRVTYVPAAQGSWVYYTINGVSTEVCHPRNDWINQAYRTVTFETAPTGELLTWLQANAVKQ